MRKTKSQKGITLIALIITIIVLLLLAVVAISAVQDDGIINHAKNARGDYEVAQGKENTTLQNYLDKLKENVPTGTGSGNTEEESEKVPTKLTITGETEVDVGSTITLSAHLDIGNVNASEITWTSSNPEVATVENGVVKGLKAEEGDGPVATTIITAKYKKLTESVKIMVHPKYVGECTECTNGKIISGYKCTECNVINEKIYFYEECLQYSCYNCPYTEIMDVDTYWRINLNYKCPSCGAGPTPHEIDNLPQGVKMLSCNHILIRS